MVSPARMRVGGLQPIDTAVFSGDEAVEARRHVDGDEDAVWSVALIAEYGGGGRSACKCMKRDARVIPSV